MTTPSRHVAEAVQTYVVHSRAALALVPIPDEPGTIVVNFFPDRPTAPPDTDAAYQAALNGAVLRARPRWRELLGSEGGVVTASQMGEVLGISRQAVDKRRKGGKLLAVEEARPGYLYPVWQIQDGKPLPGLERVLATLNAGGFSPKSQVIFFLTPRGRFYDLRALDMLRAGTEDHIHEVANAAEGYLEQGSS